MNLIIILSNEGLIIMKQYSKELNNNKLINIFILIFKSLIISILFTSASIVTGLYETKVLVVSSIMFGIISYILLNSTNKFDINFKFILTILISIIFICLMFHFKLYLKIYIFIYKENPYKRRAIVILLSLAINTIIFIITPVIISIRKLFKK